METRPVDFVTLCNLAAIAQAKTVQVALQALGFYPGAIDGAFGAKSLGGLSAYAEHFGLPARQVFVGGPGCPWTVFSDGADLCARNVSATCFGSLADVKSGQDNGICASGFHLAAHPDAKVVALPLSYTPACSGSPWGRSLPWGTVISVQRADSTTPYTGTLQDVGPSKGTGNAIDLSAALAAQVEGSTSHFNPNAFKRFVSVRVVNGLAQRK